MEVMYGEAPVMLSSMTTFLRLGRGFGILIALLLSVSPGRFREFRQVVWLAS